MYIVSLDQDSLLVALDALNTYAAAGFTVGPDWMGFFMSGYEYEERDAYTKLMLRAFEESEARGHA